MTIAPFARVLRASALAAAAMTSACVGSIGERLPGGRAGDPNGPDPNAPQGADVGATPLRRLTRAQYEHTLRDLLGLAPPSTAFSPDERVGAFHSNAVAPVTELVIEQYMTAAEELALLAVEDLDALLPCDAGGGDACVTQFIEDLGTRAYRRPLDATEVADLESVYATAEKNGGMANGVRVVVQTMLQSPFFLYHVEAGLDPAEQSSVMRPLGQYEIASRLSYFLWNSMPDDELFDAAAAGELEGADALRAQAERMLDDPKARDAVGSFHLQWLDLYDIEQLEKDTVVFPEFDAALREAMRNETASFADYVVRKGDGRLETLLTAPWSMVDGPLFELYGADAPTGHDASEPFDLDPNERAGLLTHASVLSKHAHADQTSPVFRGVLVREMLLCQALPPPPPDVANVPPEPDPNATTRERFAEHTSNPACSGCHSLIDGVGFGFEGYDGIGRFRTMENDLPVDATGEVIGTETMNGKFDGVVELAGMLAQSDEVRACVARQWFRFAYGRLETERDLGSMDAAYQAFAASEFDVRELLLAIVSTEAFSHRRIEEEVSP